MYRPEDNDKEPNLWNLKDNLSGGRLIDKELILTQYTGLKYKNGKEIYEEDICKFIILSGAEKVNPLQALLVVIKYKNTSYGFRTLFPELVVGEDRGWKPFYYEDGCYWDEKYFEVIGNIYENKELLK